MVTVRDVAWRAGVSMSTVSHVLNRTRFVSEDLCQSGRAAIRELDYEPNAAARSLSLKRSNTIGLIVSDIRNPFFAFVARGVHDVAKNQGYTVVMSNSDEQLESETVVLVDRELPCLKVSAVVVDNEGAAHGAVRHLIALGHRRIAMLTGLGSISTTTERIAGYQRALREANIQLDDRLVVSGESTSEGGADALNAVMDLEPPPTAIFSGNNLVSIGALQAIARKALNVPDELAIVGFDDFPFPWSDAFRPQLTTVAQPTYELGRQAAEMLVRQLSGSTWELAQRVVLEGTLVIRESSGAFIRPMQREGHAAAGVEG